MTKKTLFQCANWVFLDIILVNFATYMAYVIRGFLYSDDQWKTLMMTEYREMFWLILLVVTVIRIGTFFAFKLYKPGWKYASVS